MAIHLTFTGYGLAASRIVADSAIVGHDTVITLAGAGGNPTTTIVIKDYTGIADWNLRTDLEHPDSVEQNARGDGATITLRLSYRFLSHLCGWVGGDIEWWRADSGTSRTNYASGIRDETNLNQVRSGSRAARAGLRWEF